MAKVDRVFQDVVKRAAESVQVKELKGNILGSVKAGEANAAVKEAVSETAERVGAEIQANYTKPFITRLPNGNVVTTTPELNGILRETVSTNSEGKQFLSHYERTTTKGTYEIDLNPDGTYKSSTIKTPKGTKTRPYINGRYQKPVEVRDWTDLEKAHEANKGRITEHSESRDTERFGDVTVNVNRISNKFADGSSEFVKTSDTGKVLSKDITFPNGDMAHKNYETGVTYYMRDRGKFGQSTIPVTSHTDEITGAQSSAIVRKVFDEFGRDVREIEMNFANYTGIKVDKFVYTLERDGGPYSNRVSGKLISGSFDISGQARDIKKVVYTDGKLFVDGKELDGTALRELGYRPNGTTSAEYGFELLFNQALKHARIGEDFNLAKYSHLWANM